MLSRPGPAPSASSWMVAPWAVLLCAASLLLSGCSAPSSVRDPLAVDRPSSTTTARPQASEPAAPTADAERTPTPSADAERTPTPTAGPERPDAAQLPRGGRTVFPQHRLVGYSGVTGAPTLGRLGTGDLDQRMAEVERRARSFRDGREVLPVAEIIATTVHPSPGKDGMYRGRMADRNIATYLKAVRKSRGILLLNIQPGRADFLDEVKAYERWLREPDVGVALDPEWAIGEGEIPGRVFGETTGKELDQVSRYLSALVARRNLPEKVMVVHELAPRIVRRESGLKDHPGVVVVKSIDGIGSRGAKEATYRAVWRGTPDFVHPGFKLFFTEDREHGRLMTPRQILALNPKPEYVLYE